MIDKIAEVVDLTREHLKAEVRVRAARAELDDAEFALQEVRKRTAQRILSFSGITPGALVWVPGPFGDRLPAVFSHVVLEPKAEAPGVMVAYIHTNGTSGPTRARYGAGANIIAATEADKREHAGFRRYLERQAAEDGENGEGWF